MTIPSRSRELAEPSTRFGREVCVLVPMYNEDSVIASVVTDLRRSFDHVVCVDDGSVDRSAEQARSAGALVLRHPVNLGQGGGIGTGLAYVARHPEVAVAITFDADGQHRVCDAVRMAERVLAGDADVVLGSRFIEGDATSVPPLRRALLRAATVFTRLTSGLDVSDTHNGLRALSRDAAARIRVTMRGMAHASELLSEIQRQGLSYVEEPVEITYTDYSMAKGQKGLNAFNIVCDLALHRIRVAA